MKMRQPETREPWQVTVTTQVVAGGQYVKMETAMVAFGPEEADNCRWVKMYQMGNRLPSGNDEDDDSLHTEIPDDDVKQAVNVVEAAVEELSRVFLNI